MMTTPTNTDTAHLLVVEDEPIIRQSLVRLIEQMGYQASASDTLSSAKVLCQAQVFDLIISDIRLPDGQGTELITSAHPMPVMMMTSFASIKSAVDALKMGAIDYVAKPFDFDEMTKLVRHALKRSGHKAANLTPHSTSIQGKMIGEHALMQTLYQQISKAAPVDSTILIRGESGTGKELVARALHQQSHRATGPLIAVNCAAIPETLIEAELFGHEKGAFTGAQSSRKGLVEAADGGSLFLDEIGELPMEAQARLLRLLQEKEVRPVGAIESRSVDVRMIAATHRPLKQLAQAGQFREDLYYRLHVIELAVPALKDRGQDILLLAEHFISQMRKKLNCPPRHLSPQAEHSLLLYPWPGNVRELEHAIERAMVLSDSEQIEPELLGIESPQVMTATATPLETDSAPSHFKRFVLEHEKSMTETELAQSLGISRKTLWEKRQKLGIPKRK